MSRVATSSSFSVGFPITVPILLLLPFSETFQAPLTIISKRVRPGTSLRAVQKITFQKQTHDFFSGGYFKSNFSKGLDFKHLHSRKVQLLNIYFVHFQIIADV